MLSIDYCFFSFLHYYYNIVAIYNQHMQRSETAGMKHARETGPGRAGKHRRDGGWVVPGTGAWRAEGLRALGLRKPGWGGGGG